MPKIDMPLEQLKEYHGTNPKPRDYFAYWNAAIEELNSIEPQVELVASNFQVPSAECFDLYFTSVRGARIHAKYLRPKNENQTPHPAVLFFHGYTGNAGDWSDKLNYISLGFSVFAMDCRGQGGLSEDVGGVVGNTHRGHIVRGLDAGADHLLFRHIFLDTLQLARIAMSFPEVDATKVATYGGSQGGGLALVCAALEPRIQRVVSIFPFLSDYQRTWEMDLAVNAYEELRTYFRLFDPLHQREKEIFEMLGYIDVQHLVERIQGQVLMGISLMDQICPPSTQFAAYNKIQSHKQSLIFPDFGHEGLPGFHDEAMKFLVKMI
jgi:cephalosporin-C deacetylase